MCVTVGVCVCSIRSHDWTGYALAQPSDGRPQQQQQQRYFCRTGVQLVRILRTSQMACHCNIVQCLPLLLFWPWPLLVTAPCCSMRSRQQLATCVCACVLLERARALLASQHGLAATTAVCAPVWRIQLPVVLAAGTLAATADIQQLAFCLDGKSAAGFAPAAPSPLTFGNVPRQFYMRATSSSSHLCAQLTVYEQGI